MGAEMGKTIRLIDSTLRDGEQAPGVSFNRSDKIAVATMLAEAGIDELEAGIPAMGDRECEDILALHRLNLPCRITPWCRARAGDLELAARAGASSVHIGFPLSPIHLQVTGNTLDGVLEDLNRLVTLARCRFDHVSVGAMDAVRTAPDTLALWLRSACDAGAHRARIADTVGLSTPSSVAALVAGLSAAVPEMPLDFHGHNDLGMATANALTAAEHGAFALSVTVNGLGERAGNAATEEVAAAIHFASPLTCRLRPEALAPVCARVARASGRPIRPDKPVTGSAVFDHESGIHGQGQLKHPLAFQPFTADVVGHAPGRLVLGTHSGTAMLTHLLDRAGIALTTDQARELLSVIRSQTRREKRPLDTLKP
ncbi:homocitrate synthase [Desulfatiferula olefinivorans]